MRKRKNGLAVVRNTGSLLKIVGILRPAGAAALDRVGVVDAPAVAQEIVQPAFAAVGLWSPR